MQDESGRRGEKEQHGDGQEHNAESPVCCFRLVRLVFVLVRLSFFCVVVVVVVVVGDMRGHAKLANDERIGDGEERQRHQRVEAGVNPRPGALHEAHEALVDDLAAHHGAIVCAQAVRVRDVHVGHHDHNDEGHDELAGRLDRRRRRRRLCVHGDEAIGGHEHEQPGARVKRGDEDERGELARRVRHVRHQVAVEQKEPEVATVRHEHRLVHNRHSAHVHVGRLLLTHAAAAAAAAANSDRHGQHVAYAAEREQDWKGDELERVQATRGHERVVNSRACVTQQLKIVIYYYFDVVVDTGDGIRGGGIQLLFCCCCCCCCLVATAQRAQQQHEEQAANAVCSHRSLGFLL